MRESIFLFLAQPAIPMKHYLITNREIYRDSNGNEQIRPDGGERAGDNLRFGTYDIDDKKFEIFPEPRTEADLAYRAIKVDDKTDTLHGSSRFFKELYDAMMLDSPLQGDVLVFIHGFNTSLKSVEEAFRSLHENYVIPDDNSIKHIVILTWPGKKKEVPLHYRNDKKDAERSGEAFARGIEKLIGFFIEFLGPADSGNPACGKNLHLMAHSMGNRVLKHMVLELLKERQNLPELFKSISLVAADVEYDIFEYDGAFRKLIDMGDKINIYYHRGDNILDISKYTKNFTNRLGRVGRSRNDPNQPAIQEFDCTLYHQDQGDLLERKGDHWYYYTSSQAIQLIKANF